MKKPPNDNKTPLNKDPTIAPIIAGLLFNKLSDGCILVALPSVDSDEDIDIVDFEVADGGELVEGTKLLVHIY